MMRNGSTLRLDEQSVLDIDALDEDNADFYLEMGRLYVNFRGTSERCLRADTPEASVRAQTGPSSGWMCRTEANSLMWPFSRDP